MFEENNLSTKTIEQIVIRDQNSRFALMDRLIGNAERHGEANVARALSRTMDDYALI